LASAAAAFALVFIRSDPAILAASRATSPAGSNVDPRSRSATAAFAHEAQFSGAVDSFEETLAQFGSAIAVSGDTVVVGAPYDNATVADMGHAYVFVRSGTTWSVQQVLVASDGAAGDNFGHAVAISGDLIVIGARYGGSPSGSNAGAVYVFARTGTTWSELQKLLPADLPPVGSFGHSVSLSADTIVVGAPLDSTPGRTDAGSAYVFVQAGPTWVQQQKLIASDPGVLNYFGFSVSVSGDRAVVGAPSDPLRSDTGAVYVFVRAAGVWSEEQKLLASDGTTNDFFGYSIALDGNTIVVGARSDDAPPVDAGSAYVFVQSGAVWIEQQKLVAPDQNQDANFGHTVSISGDTVVVGSPHNDGSGAYSGAAYAFVRSQTVWTLQQKLVAADTAAFDRFGFAVSISGETVAVGAQFSDTPNTADGGSAYIFVRSGTSWIQEQKLLAGEPPGADAFGSAVTVSGDTAVIGSPHDDTVLGIDTGSAYVFERSGTTWVAQQKFLPFNAAPADNFGASVAVSGDTLIVGAPGRDTTAGADAGAAYVFIRAGSFWLLQQTLLASDGFSLDRLGSSVSISGETAVVGAPSHANGSGAAYVFVRNGTSWTQQQQLLSPDAAVDDAFGDAVSIDADTVVVAEVGDDATALDAGAAFVFVRTGTAWSLQQKLIAPDAAQNDRFGHSVSVSGETALVGAIWEDIGPAGDNGAAYVFVRSGTAWTAQQKLLASDAAGGDQFGFSVSVSGDTAVVGAAADDVLPLLDVGSAYVFVRSANLWTQSDKLVAPDGTQSDLFGTSVSLAGATVVIGSPYDDVPTGAADGGSAHVFRGPESDLAVTKTDGQTTAVPGETITYTILVSNAGPSAVTGAVVTDLLPTALLGATWTCLASPGSSCTSGGSGNIDDIVNLAVGGTATYTVTATVAAGATGALSNTVTVTPPSGTLDPDPANNSATDIDTLTPETDLAITKTDSADPVSPGDPLSYNLAFINDGPSDATGVTVVDTLPAGVTFVSSVPGPPTCTAAGSTLTCDMGGLTAGSNGTVTINVTVDAGASGMLVNTATVSGSETDPNTANNTAQAATAVGRRDGELRHGTDELHDLAALPGPVTDEDIFRIYQEPEASYEVVIDATSGDIGAGDGPILERLAPDGTTVLQTSVAIGAGPSRSLRWSNDLPFAVEGETIRVRSAGCTTDCGPDDVYRIRAHDTTYSIARFNNAGSQVTVLILHNTTSEIMGGVAFLRDLSGVVVCSLVFGVSGHHSVVVDTTTCPGAEDIAGSITVRNSLRYGEISGKAVALEPATGFSFDTPLEPRVK
jgi:uncharacterized repeat protein (TIGR01451 family)